jgi:catalase
MQIMGFEDAADYRFNPFDLTKVWPHSDYPAIKIGRLTLNRNPEDYFAQIEQAAFEPSNMVPGVGPSPDKMLLGRMFSYPDTHRHRIGTNYLQLPVNRPKSPVNSYNKDGAMRYENPGDPVYAPNSVGGPVADPALFGDPTGWTVSGEIIRAAYDLHKEDDDFGQAGTLYRAVLSPTDREHLVGNIAGHVKSGVSEPMIPRVLAYWRQVDADLGSKLEKTLKTGK